MAVAVPVVCGVLGLLVGSFLNVVIHRVPLGESVVSPRSRCPQCGTQLSERDNIPVISWLVLRGRCRTCSAPISPRYPLVEALTGAVFVTIAVRIGWHAELPAYLLFVAVLIAVSAIDLERYIIPTKIVYPALGASIVLLAVAAAADHDWFSFREAIIGMAVAFAVLFLIHFISPRGMGFGDVRLSALLGLFLGWLTLGHVALGLFLGFLFGALGSIGLMAAKLRTRKDRIPFGPFLAMGAYTAVLFGRPLLDLYLRR